MNNILPRDITASKAEKIGHVVDHLVDALGGEPACTLRRAVILTDIDQHPGTTQTEIISRLDVHKSALNRDIEWLYDYGCIMRQSGEDGRTLQLTICGYAKRNLDLALEYFEHDHKSLKNFLIRLITLFGDHRPTLRDAKIMAVVSDKRAVTKQQVYEGLYNGPSSTDQRALGNLIDFGFIRKLENVKDEENEIRTG